MSYFNTTHVYGKKLVEYQIRATCQEEKILRLFLAYPSRRFTPTEVLTFCFKNDAMEYLPPLTSIRRALTNLTNHDDIHKTDIQRKGAYGRLQYTWRLNPKHQQKDLFQ